MSEDFSGQVVVITGAAGGIGSAIAQAFYQRGACLAIADRDEESLSRVAASLDSAGERLLSVSYDAADSDDAQRLVTACVSRFGHIDHVVPAAAIYQRQPFAEMTDAQWRKTMAVNLDGVFYLCRRAIPHIRTGGSIVTIASSAGHEGCSPEHVHYGASKGGVLGFSKSLAREIAPAIRVNSVSPGTIRTPMVDQILRVKGDKFLSVTPAGRFGEADEVASAVLFLCSEAASYITGSAIHVNGGSYMGG